MAEWFETFFSGLYGRVLAGQFDSARSLQDARTVKNLLGARRGQSVLDIPCGIGRLTLPLSRTGLRMTGVDLTASFLRRGKKAGSRQALSVSWVHSDMREIEFRDEFDAAFNWFGSFGYFSEEDNLAFCRRILRALKPGGRLLVEGMNRSWLLTHWRSGDERTIKGVRVVDRALRFDRRANRVWSLWTMARGRQTERHRMSMWIFNGADIRALLRKAGFTDIRLFGYPPIRRLTRHSRRIIAVGRRPLR